MRFSSLCLVACLVSGGSDAFSEPRQLEVQSDVADGDRIQSGDPTPKQENPDDSPVPNVNSPLSKMELCGAAAVIANTNNLPPAFFIRLIKQESGFKSLAVSPAGAQGIAQFMPRTASSRGLANPFDPLVALAASGKYLAELVTRFGNLGLAAAAYNAGPGRVRNWIAKRGRLPAETRDYVSIITGHAPERWIGGQGLLAIPSSIDCPDGRAFGGIVRAQHPKHDAANTPALKFATVSTTKFRTIRKLPSRGVGTAPNGRPIGSPGSGKGSPEDPW